jgi:pimeloyl-ACP methyl ester carboxylesterase
MNAGIGDCSRRRLLGGGALLAAGVALSGRGLAAENAPRNGTARINGLNVYYEIHGGPPSSTVVPMVLLGGGALTIENAFTPECIARFARRRPVIAIEQQGHGHTADRPGKPMTIDLMVEDTAGVLAHLGVRQADLLGHSLGGMVAAGVAIHHPAIVKSLTTLGTPYQLDGFLPEIARMQRDPTLAPSPEMIPLMPTETDFAAWRESFERTAPDPTAFDGILARLNAMLGAWPGWTEVQLRGIQAPTLIAIGDNDYVRLDHAAEVARLIPKARLAVLPGTTHFGTVKRDAWLEPMIDALTLPAV